MSQFPNWASNIKIQKTGVEVTANSKVSALF